MDNTKHLLLALSGVPLDYNATAVYNILEQLSPGKARIMWASKDFQVASLILSLTQKQLELLELPIFLGEMG